MSRSRPVQITLIAAIALIGGGLVMLLGIIDAISLPGYRLGSLALLVAGACGVAAGGGLLLGQRWARVWVVVVAALTVYLIAYFAPLFAVMQVPARPGVPALTEGRKIIVLSFCLLAAVTGLWSAHVLNTKTARDWFGVPPALRPFSIAVIGWYLVMNGITTLGLRLTRTPHWAPIDFGFVFTGWAAAVILISYPVVDLFLGVGLLQRKGQIRRIAFYFGAFQLLDLAVFLLRPDREANVKAYYSAIAPTRPAPVSLFPLEAFSRFMRLASIEWAVLIVIALWFLLARRNAFTRSAEAPQGALD